MDFAKRKFPARLQLWLVQKEFIYIINILQTNILYIIVSINFWLSNRNINEWK